MNAVEALLKNGEDTTSKNLTACKSMVHDNQGGRLIISDSYKITIYIWREIYFFTVIFLELDNEL